MLFSGLTLDLDPTYIVVLALMTIPFLILNTLVFGPFLKIFDERHDRIEGALERADKKIEEAERNAKAFETKIEIATTKGVERRNAIRAEAQSVMATRIEAERKRVGEKVAGAVAEIQKTRTEAMAKVDDEARKLAAATAAKLIGRGL